MLNYLDEFKKIPFWHQTIEVAPGIFTPGLQNTKALQDQLNIPLNLEGKRVLDLGARDGYFSFECEKRGASEVIAIDYTPPHLTGFNICKKLLSSNVKFITSNIYALNKLDLGKFDYVLFLGLIYHLRHPYLALDRIYDVMNMDAELVVESHIIDEGFVDHDKVWVGLKDFNSELPGYALAQIYTNGNLGNDPTNAWAPNLAALRIMLENSGFSVFRELNIGFRGVCNARKIELEHDHPRYMDTSSEFQIYSFSNPMAILKNGEI